ncbi:TetR/AcrR family transcriptional regulator [Streptomyces flavofungini]|uniref:TetR/AcrR family transcriptional regulator n=1 Tax=Streptomyces flavofungini TaxID=68200 RepID=UPI0025B23150|nr:TetR/AcrR family transcriptional regulator [Streptomyces flavofungini]WJV46234.1 TetR/AcrR family transcriptional regulator [Streptomyces flavofungini]
MNQPQTQPSKQPTTAPLTAGPTTTGRPARADAVRNRERIVTAAREAFAEAGPEASLNEIARRAGVGPGTLYRHFSGRPELLAAVLKERIDILCARAQDLLTAQSTGTALAEWLRAFLDHARVNQGLGGALMLEELEATGALGSDCHQRILDAAGALLTRAQGSGAARHDLSPADLLQLVVGVALSTTRKQTSPAGDPEQPERLLGLVLDATKPR